MVRVRRSGHGGPRVGAGRPRGPASEIRRNRVALMLTDGDLAKLQRLAESKGLPVSTVAYELLDRGLRRTK